MFLSLLDLGVAAKSDRITPKFLSLLDLGVAAKSDRITPKVFINRTVHDHIAGKLHSISVSLYFD